MACKLNLPWSLFADTINTVSVGFGNQKFFSATFTVVNSFVYSTVDEQQANWIFAQFGRTQTDKVQWFSPIYGKQLACDCGQSMCHAELDELVRELVMSGAVANPDSSPLLRRTSRPFLSVFWCKGQPSPWNREKKNQEKDESDGHFSPVAGSVSKGGS